MSVDAYRALVGRHGAALPQPHDLPAKLPQPRGPITAALLDYLRRDPASTRVDPARLTWSGATTDAATDHDVQLALWLVYELPYRGLAGVDDGWERHPGLVHVIQEWEDLLLDALGHATSATSVGGDTAPLIRMAAGSGVLSLSRALIGDATADQVRELLVHRSIHYLKGADPHTWGIPRLNESVRAAMATLRPDGDRSAAPEATNAHQFRSLLAEWGLNTSYAHYLDCVPGVTLLTSNMISMFGLHRRLRAALVGNLAMVDLTAAVPESTSADSDGQTEAYGISGGVAVAAPELNEDVLFGARCAAYANEQFAAWVLPRWTAGESSLLQGFSD